MSWTELVLASAVIALPVLIYFASVSRGRWKERKDKKATRARACHVAGQLRNELEKLNFKRSHIAGSRYEIFFDDLYSSTVFDATHDEIDGLLPDGVVDGLRSFHERMKQVQVYRQRSPRVGWSYLQRELKGLPELKDELCEKLRVLAFGTETS